MSPSRPPSESPAAPGRRDACRLLALGAGLAGLTLAACAKPVPPADERESDRDGGRD